jgi:N-sulfoglucosamine sulfohydrolase
VRTAYARMEKPPRWELYDLQADPHEFRDLAADPAHAATLARLQGALGRWREETSDPLLKPSNLARLKAEISAVRKQEAREQSWDYPYYFFGQEPPARVEGAATPARKRKKEK